MNIVNIEVFMIILAHTLLMVNGSNCTQSMFRVSDTLTRVLTFLNTTDQRQNFQLSNSNSRVVYNKLHGPTINDIQFLQNITSKHNTDYNYKLDDESIRKIIDIHTRLKNNSIYSKKYPKIILNCINEETLNGLYDEKIIPAFLNTLLQIDRAIFIKLLRHSSLNKGELTIMAILHRMSTLAIDPPGNCKLNGLILLYRFCNLYEKNQSLSLSSLSNYRDSKWENNTFRCSMDALLSVRHNILTDMNDDFVNQYTLHFMIKLLGNNNFLFSHYTMASQSEAFLYFADRTNALFRMLLDLQRQDIIEMFCNLLMKNDVSSVLGSVKELLIPGIY
eukprot:208278_1